MKFELNPDFVWVKKNDGISITSVLPDQNEIMHFKGDTAAILESWFSSKSAQLDRSQYKIDITDEDWKAFIDFLVDKKILLSK